MKKVNRELLEQLKLTQETGFMRTDDIREIEDSLWDSPAPADTRGSSMEGKMADLNTLTTI